MNEQAIQDANDDGDQLTVDAGSATLVKPGNVRNDARNFSPSVAPDRFVVAGFSPCGVSISSLTSSSLTITRVRLP